MNKFICLGITGIIGAGKSTVLDLLKSYSFTTINCDLYIKELLKNNPKLKKNILKHFNLNEDNNMTLINKKIANIIFSNKQELRWLENIIHPKVINYIHLIKKTHQRLAIEIPLLFEKKLEYLFDYIICVYITPNLQKERLKSRGLTYKEISKINLHHFPQQIKAEKSNIIINNNYGINHLKYSIYNKIIKQIKLCH